MKSWPRIIWRYHHPTLVQYRLYQRDCLEHKTDVAQECFSFSFHQALLGGLHCRGQKIDRRAGQWTNIHFVSRGVESFSSEASKPERELNTRGREVILPNTNHVGNVLVEDRSDKNNHNSQTNQDQPKTRWSHSCWNTKRVLLFGTW